MRSPKTCHPSNLPTQQIAGPHAWNRLGSAGFFSWVQAWPLREMRLLQGCETLQPLH